jgi:hypothetical protein
MLTNMHCCPAEDDFCDRHKAALNPATVQLCFMWNNLANLICISRQTYKLQRSPFFHLLDILFLNGFISLTSSGLWIIIHVSDLHLPEAWYKRGQGCLNLRQSHRQDPFHQARYMTQQTLAVGRKRNSALSLYFHSVMLDCMLVSEVVLHQTGFMKTVWSDWNR